MFVVDVFDVLRSISSLFFFVSFFFFNDTATTEIYTLSLHDARRSRAGRRGGAWPPASPRASARGCPRRSRASSPRPDRKSTRLNSSHQIISYAVFCLNKKNIKECRHYKPCSTIARMRDIFIHNYNG